MGEYLIGDKLRNGSIILRHKRSSDGLDYVLCLTGTGVNAMFVSWLVIEGEGYLQHSFEYDLEAALVDFERRVK